VARFATGFENFRVDTAAIVTKAQTQLRWIVSDFHFNAFCTRVVQRIYEGLLADPICFISDQRVKLSQVSLYNNAEFDALREPQLQWQTKQSLYSDPPRFRDSAGVAARQPSTRRGQFILVNASAYFIKEKPKNVLTDEGIAAVSDAFQRWQTQEKLSRVITLKQVREADYNLSPSLFVETNNKVHHRPLCQILADLDSVRLEGETADAELNTVLARLQLR